ncbi:MAG: hypothetical protein Kow0037_29580 [Calditrichia bacterium]
MKHYLIGFFIILALTAAAWSQNYYALPYGQSWHFPDARSLALGGAASVALEGAPALFYNPAGLFQEERALLQLSPGFRKLSERRSYPLYDRFESVVGDGIYAINDNYYPDLQAAFSLRLNLLKKLPLTLGWAVFKEQDFRYTYDEEVRDNIFGDPVLGFNKIEYGGMITRYSLGAAAAIPGLKGLTFGLQAGILKGELRTERFYHKLSSGEKVGSKMDASLDNTPVVLSMGAIYQLNERIRLGADLRLPYKIKYTVLNDEYQYPLAINFAAQYRARQIIQAVLNVEVGYEFWSDVDNPTFVEPGSVSPTNFDDVFKLKAGLEHIFYNQVPFRVGMQYRNSYFNRGTTQTLLTVGTGFRAANWTVDVSGAVSSTDYHWPDLFDDTIYGGDRSNSLIDRVEETFFLGMVTLTYFLNF